MPDPETERRGDAALIRAIAAGERSAFEALVLRHGASIRRLARAMTTDDATADDVLQEVFVSAWRAAGTFRGDGSARGWLLTMTRHAAQRTHRRRVGEPGRAESLESLACDAGWGAAPDAPLDRVLADRQRLAAALDALQPDDREILVLVELEGLDIDEAAQTLGLKLNATKSRLHRARLRMVAAARKEPA